MKKALWVCNELINKVCLVSCIVLKLKGMTINFPALKALQRDCIKIQFTSWSSAAPVSCLAWPGFTINKNLFSQPIFIRAPTSRKFTLEKQILFFLSLLVNVCGESQWVGRGTG